LYAIRNKRRLLDQGVKIHKNEFGVYVEAKTKIKTILYEMAESKIGKKNLLNLMQRIIRIKLTGDSGNVGRYLKLLNFTFSAVDFLGSQSYIGNYTLGLFEMQEESYNELNISLKEILASLEDFNFLSLNDKNYKIKFYLGGDLKFLANVMGLNSATANYPCVWWTCHKDNFQYYSKKVFSIKNNYEHARCCEESNMCLNKKTIDGRLGYMNASLITFIPNHQIIIDPLHVCLRISDKLFDHLLHDIELLDEKFKPNIEENIYFSILIKFLKEKCKLKNPYYVSDGQYKL